MAAYDDKVDETEPQGDEQANTIDDLFRELKRALVERIAVEHFDISFNGTSGTSSEATNAQFRHIAGMVGAIGMGTHADMAALATTYGQNPGVGAFFMTTDPSGAPNNYPAGTLYRYSGGWQKIEWYEGVIYATEAEAIAGSRADVSISPSTLSATIAAKSVTNVNPFLNYALFKDEKTSGTYGQTATYGVFIKRNLVEDYNDIDGASITSDVITLPAGTYRVVGSGSGGSTGDGTTPNVSTTVAALFEGDVGSAAALIARGETAYSGGDDGSAFMSSRVVDVFTFAVETTMTFRQYVTWSHGSGLLGVPNTIASMPEVYAQLEIWKLD